MHKLTLSLLMVAIIATLGLGWALDGLFERYSNHSQEDDLTPYRETGISLAKMIDLHKNSKQAIEQINSDHHLEFSVKPFSEFLLPSEISTEFTQGRPLTLESDDSLTLNFYLPKKQQVFTIALPATSQTSNEKPLRLFFTVIFYVGTLMLLLLWLYPLVNHLIKLKEAAKAFGKGDLDQRISTNSISYISEIEIEFNRMAGQIQTLISDNKLLGSAVSHDLRTPLARLRFGIDVLSEVDDPKTRKKYQQRISQDVDEMESLVETLLDYTKLDQSMVKLEKTELNLETTINSCLSKVASQSKKIEFEHPAKVVTIVGNERYLSMLINNIIQNALQYADHHILISITVRKDHTLLAVDDDGEGILESERAQVLKPFVRGSLAKTNQGYGMGLAISKRITEWHGGKLVILNSKKLGGARIETTFPIQTTHTQK
ncbi:MAG: ATP-binding protein [Gammaproteobacteria bacterium]|nr:ATP-binding protein [Gammaproteobacteria bacterium]